MELTKEDAKRFLEWQVKDYVEALEKWGLMFESKTELMEHFVQDMQLRLVRLSRLNIRERK